jgi:hypothetical protein
MNIVTSCILQCKLECAIVIVDNQTKSDTDNNDDNDFQYISSGTRNHNSFSNADFLTKDHHKTEGIGDAVMVDERRGLCLIDYLRWAELHIYMAVHELFLTCTRRSGQGPNRYRCPQLRTS